MGSRKLRVIHTITGLTFGGAQRSLIDLILSYPEWVETEVFALYPGAMAEQLRSRGIRVHEDELRGLSSLKSISRWRSAFLGKRPHIVHTHLGKADLCGRIAARLARVPLVLTTSWNLEDWKEIWYYNLLDNMTFKLADGIIACSKRAKDYLVEKGQPAGKVIVSYGRAELRERFQQDNLSQGRREELLRELVIEEGTLITIMVGRMYPQKAHDTAIGALKALGDANGRKHVLLFAGDGPLRAEIEALALQLLRPDQYRFLGNRADVADLMLLADVFLMPSRWEGSPLALSESYAAGLPSVLSNIPSMDEIAAIGQGSVIAPVDNPEAIANVWRELLLDPERRVELGARARQNALEKLDIRIMCDEYLRYYAQLARKSPRMRREELPGPFVQLMNDVG